MRWFKNVLVVLCLTPLVLALSASSAANGDSSLILNNKPPIIPITVLSGFLGSGKTTLLQNMLHNKQGLKIAIVVNDVASVNIDSKLVTRDNTTPNALGGSDGMVELQNGCACCSRSDELLTSVSELVTMSDLRADGEQFQHIVVEMSGVADPKQVRAKFQEAALEQMPLMERVSLDTMVTLVDSSMFESYFKSTRTASRKEMPELFFRDGVVPEPEQEEWMKELPPKLLEAVLAGMNAAQDRDESNGVADLLVSQTETADIVVLNKIDLADDQEIERLKEITLALNPRAKILTTAYGKIAISEVLGVAEGLGVAVAGAVDDHRDFIAAAVSGDEVGPSNADCIDPECTDPSHSHSDAHQEHSLHSHSHDHGEPACTDPDCTDASHSHSHDHSSDAANSACSDPDCTDPSHGHTHSHSTASSHAGIGTFVYTARRPFHPGRLVSFLRNLPVVRGVPKVESEETEHIQVSPAARDLLSETLRSKGFVWCADSHKAAMYWSHAGSSFELSCLGQWWATLPRDQWPPDVNDYVLQDFDVKEHDDATNDIGVGDRRQEVVFIGNNFGGKEPQSLIQESLDQCLLDDVEYEEYKSIRTDEEKLQARFANVIESKYVTY